jgi:hypothetical protein
VLALYAVLFLLSVALVARAIVDPHAALRGVRGPGSLVAAVFLIPLVGFYAPRAWRARNRREAE